MNEQRIQKINDLLTSLQPSELEIIDDSHKHIGHVGAQGGAGHFTVKIGSPLFAEKSRLQCHKMIYDLLGEMIPEHIHALSIKLLA